MITHSTSSALTELIRARRSITVFKPEPLPDGTIEDLLESAVYAPNHRLTQPWRFVILTGAGVTQYATIRREMAMPAFRDMNAADREKAAEKAYQKFARVPAYLLVIMAESPNVEIAEEDYAACAALTQNFLLLAWERGIGSCWKTFKSSPAMREFIGLQVNEKVVASVHLGYPAEIPTSTRKPAQDRITYRR